MSTRRKIPWTASTGLAVFTGDDLASLTQVEGACHTSVRGSAYIAFAARKTSTYYFQITEVATGGPLVFNLDPLGTTEMASVSSDERHGNSSASWTAMSADGRFVAFDSDLTGLAPGDGPGAEEEGGLAGYDVFVHDRLTRRTTLVSASAQGANGNAYAWSPNISADGRFVAFLSAASNLVPGDDPGALVWVRELTAQHVYVRDLRTGGIQRVSVSGSGEKGNDFSFAPAMSADGRFVAFGSAATNLVPGDANHQWNACIAPVRSLPCQ